MGMEVNIFRRLVALVSVAVLLLVAGCDSGGSDAAEETGTVTGRVTAADGVTPIPGALVGLAGELGSSMNAASKSGRPLGTVLNTAMAVQQSGPTATTDGNGEFTLEGVPVGTQTLIAKRGAFEATFEVDVQAEEVVTAPDTKLESTKALAYVPGLFDSIEDIVSELGNEIEEITLDDLSDAETLEQYAIVFINCGSGTSYPQERLDAMRAYMEAGGTIYASDLEQDYAELLFPDDIEFEGNGSDQEVEATIVSDDLEAFVGKSTVPIQYDLGGWERIVSVSDVPEVLLRGTPEERAEGDEPLAVTFEVGQGRLVYTTFHNEAGVTADQEVVLRYFIYLPV